MNSRQRAEEFTRFVGLELKGAITARGYKATQVATEINRSPAAFNRWLNGKVEIPMTVLCEACEFIDVDPKAIVEIAYDRVAVAYGERNGSKYEAEEVAETLEPVSQINAAFPKHLSAVPDSVAAYKNDGTHLEFEGRD
ncbi:helix-turn-helix domain-containing protein [Timonella sp. A28]|uniref:helix-turn-helix domain-containing protein n=1 Tax=Timonella sp. A28 TaxID=3442640 RepID=UPI003EB8D6F6